MRAAFALAAVSAIALRAAPAHADAAAEALFQEGRQLLAAGDLPGACDRFQRSSELEAKVGTLLNLGNCREQQGQLADAWSAFSDARSLATVQGDTVRIDEAQKRAIALEPKLAWLTITVAADGRAAELAITRDGKPVNAAVWDRAVPVDPGTHAIEARAPGYKPWTHSLSIALGARDAVAVPPLDPDPNAVRPDGGGERPVGAGPRLKTFAVGAAFGGTSDTDIVGGGRLIGGYPVPRGQVRANLQYLYTRWHPDDDPYHTVQLHAIGLGFDYLLPWSKGLASAAGIGAGIDITDDNYDTVHTDNWFAVRASPLIVRLGSPSLELGLHAHFVVPQNILIAVVGIDWFVR